MAIDLDAKLALLAAEIMRDSVQMYEPGAALNPVLSAWAAGMFGGMTETASLIAVTGSFAAVTGSFPALTGSFRAIGQDPEEPLITLKRVFRLPGKLPGVRLLPEPELVALARSAPTMTALTSLALWLGAEGRLVGQSDELTSTDAAEAAKHLGIRREALSSLWDYALTSGWIELADSGDRRRTSAVIGPTAWHWANGGDRGALHVWAAVFAAVASGALTLMAHGDPAAARKLNFEGQGVALATALFLARRSGMTGRDVEDLVRKGTVGERPTPRHRRSWDAWIRKHGDPAHRLLGEFAALRAVTIPRTADGTVELTPLALWALREQFALDKISVPVLRPPSTRMSVADLVALSDAVSEAEFSDVFSQWMHGRDPDQAARELLIYAGSVDPHGRLAAVDIARRIGAPAYRAWKDAMKRPELRGYARVSLSMMAGSLPESAMPLGLEPDPDDMAWLATDLLAIACGADQPDPEVIRAKFAEAVPDGNEARILGLMTQGSHPDTTRVLSVLSTCHPDRRVAREARKAVRALARDRGQHGRRRVPARAAS